MAQNALLKGFESEDPLAVDALGPGGVDGSTLTLGIGDGRYVHTLSIAWQTVWIWQNQLLSPYLKGDI